MSEGRDSAYWLEQKRGSLMVVATVIATMTFQISINPPGGVWETNADTKEGCAPGKKCRAGTSVLASSDNHHKQKYGLFILLCTISFFSSIITILLLLCGISLRKKSLRWLLIVVMTISTICISGAYAICMWLILDPKYENEQIINNVARFLALILGVLIVLVCACLISCYLLQLLWQFFTFLFKASCQSCCPV